MTQEDASKNIDPTFKGWTKPGPLPDMAQREALELEPGETLDALSGHFRIAQLKKGHRFSTDDILTAWYGTSWCPSVRTALDLGSGIGTVAMMVAWRCPGAHVVGVEAQQVSVALARKSSAYNGLQGRHEIRVGDFREQGIEPDERFDLITGTPPYFPLDTGVVSPHPQKRACRFEVRGGIEAYCEVAARHLGAGGVFASVFPVKPAHQYERVVSAASDAGLTIVRWRPVALRQQDGPLLGLFLMQRNEHLPESMRGQTWEEPTLVVRREDGTLHPEYRAVKMSFGFPP